MNFSPRIVSILALLASGFTTSIVAQDAPTFPDGTSFKITVIEADGFVEKDDDGTYSSGYVVDMIKTVSKAANFDYELIGPSGLGPNCNPQLMADTEGVGSATYASQYLCGQNDVLNGDVVPATSQTGMYRSMYFVSAPRQVAGLFSLSFKSMS